MEIQDGVSEWHLKMASQDGISRWHPRVGGGKEEGRRGRRKEEEKCKTKKRKEEKERKKENNYKNSYFQIFSYKVESFPIFWFMPCGCSVLYLQMK
jgi:hypothetical protein